MSYRELWVFLRHLPQESWTQTKIRDEHLDDLVNPEPAQSDSKFGPWSLLNHQIAVLTDAINQNTYVTAVAGRLENPPKPELTPRPGVPRGRPQRVQPEWAVRYLNRLRATG